VALGVQDGFHVRAQAFVLVGAGVEHLERLADQHLARGAKHLADLRLQSIMVRLRDKHHAHGSHIEGQSVINVHSANLYGKLLIKST
jgi:hypothetical protein